MDGKTTAIVVGVGVVLILGIFSANRPLEAVVHATLKDLTLLARLIEAEAGGEPYPGKVAVGAVVVNRVLDPRFPDSIRAVIYEPNQFYTEGLEQISRPSAEARKAAEEALQGADPTGGALYFYNPKTAQLAPWWSSLTPLVQIGEHVFLR